MQFGTEHGHRLFNQFFCFEFKTDPNTFQLRQNLLVINVHALTTCIINAWLFRIGLITFGLLRNFLIDMTT